MVNREKEKNLTSTEMLKAAGEIIKEGQQGIMPEQTVKALEERLSVRFLNPDLLEGQLAKTTKSNT